MLLEEVDPDGFKAALSDPYHIYGSADFNLLNEFKVQNAYYLLFKDTKYRLAIIGGVVDNIFSSPFSAPFGGFLYIHNDIRLQSIEEAIDLLINWCNNKNISGIKIVMPPSFYDQSFIAKNINVFYRKKFEISTVDLNYHFTTSNLNDDYKAFIWRNAKKNLNISFSHNLIFEECLTEEQRTAAYSIIKLNRSLKGKPLKLSYDELSETSKIIKSKYFIVKDRSGSVIASAVGFIVGKSIAQIIYWGDNPEFGHYKTMNFLSFKVFEYYKNYGIQTVDLGYSTLNSEPNYGLCEFKESLGCEINPKFTFIKKL